MEVAAQLSSDAQDMIDILAKFTEVPAKVKLVQLSSLMYSKKPKKGVEAEFKNILSSVPMDLVRIYKMLFFEKSPNYGNYLHTTNIGYTVAAVENATLYNYNVNKIRQ